MAIDLKAYAERVGHKGALAPDLATLKDLHLAHATHITFENLDVLLHQPIRLDLESLWAKIITGGRGGYCFEQNALFAAVLEAIGLRVTRLAAWVRRGNQKITPRSHMLLAVEVAGERSLADVGFDDGLLHPIPLRIDKDDAAVQLDLSHHHRRPLPRLAVAARQRMVRSLRLHVGRGASGRLRGSELHLDQPHSPFVHMIFVSRPGIDARWTLINRRLIEQRPYSVKETMLANDDAVLGVLAERFGLLFAPASLTMTRSRRWLARYRRLVPFVSCPAFARRA